MQRSRNGSSGGDSGGVASSKGDSGGAGGMGGSDGAGGVEGSHGAAMTDDADAAVTAHGRSGIAASVQYLVPLSRDICAQIAAEFLKHVLFARQQIPWCGMHFRCVQLCIP
jgi:hypothetical protein